MEPTNREFRCVCEHRPKVAFSMGGTVYLKRGKYAAVTYPPVLLRCAECGRWFTLGADLSFSERDGRLPLIPDL